MSEKLILDPGDPLKCAIEFKNAICPNVWSPQIRWWWDYDKKLHCYREVSQATMQADMQMFLAKALIREPSSGNLIPFKPDPKDVKTVVESLQNHVHRSGEDTKPPMWLDGRDVDPRLILPCANGLLNIKTRELIAHTPKFFCTYCLPHGYYPNQEVPQLWLDTLDQWFADPDGNSRQHLVDALQEAFGYTLSTNRNLQKIFFARGVRGSGKGTTFRVLTALCGENQIASESLAMLGEKYGLEPLLDKLALMVPDVTMGNKIQMGEASSRLKSISGQDALTVRRMAITSLANVFLQCQIWMGGNILPNFGDDMDALMRRLLAFPFDNSFEDSADYGLTDKLTQPDMLAGILNWSLEGYDRLMERGKFAEWPESAEIKTELLRLSNPVAAFVSMCCDVKAGTEIDKADLYRVYSEYCIERDIDPIDSTQFSRRLKDAVQAGGRVLGEHRATTDDGRRPNAWRGVRLNADYRVRYYRHNPDLVELTGAENTATIATEPKSGRPIFKDDASLDFKD